MIDATGIEATDQINYRGAKIVKTPVGGLFTLIAGLAVLIIAGVMFSELFGPEKFVESISINYMTSQDS
jgi:hypothetical protein